MHIVAGTRTLPMLRFIGQRRAPGGHTGGTECTSQRVGKNPCCQRNGKREVIELFDFIALSISLTTDGQVFAVVFAHSRFVVGDRYLAARKLFLLFAFRSGSEVDTWGGGGDVQGVQNVPCSAWVKTDTASKTANATSVETHTLAASVLPTRCEVHSVPSRCPPLAPTRHR
jgi:hypothetical protein